MATATQQKATEERIENPHAKHSYRVLNQPFMLFGIIDWKVVLVSAVPAAAGGLWAHSWLAGLVILLLVAWRVYGYLEEDPLLPLVLWLTVFDKKHLCCFVRGKQ